MDVAGAMPVPQVAPSSRRGGAFWCRQIIGREFGSAFIDAYTELKSLMIRYSQADGMDDAHAGLPLSCKCSTRVPLRVSRSTQDETAANYQSSRPHALTCHA